MPPIIQKVITAAPQARERAHLYAAILAMRYIRHSKERGRLEYAAIVYLQPALERYHDNTTTSVLFTPLPCKYLSHIGSFTVM